MSNLPTKLTRIILLHVILCWTVTAGCKWDEFEIQDVFHNISCAKCPSCPKGQGLSPECGSFISYGTRIECKPCIPGETYSNKDSINSCSPCAICSDHQDFIKNCTATSNSVCEHGCNKGFYLDEMTDDCQPCSWCCGDKDDGIADECVSKGMPTYKRCTVQREVECTPKCSADQYTLVDQNAKYECVNCPPCDTGYAPTHKCGTTIEGPFIMNCTRCESNTFSDKKDSTPCTPCSHCTVGKIEERGCTAEADTMCGACKRGFYQSTDGECAECSNCCGDDKDVREDECIHQGMPPSQQCRYTDRSVEVCQEKNKGKLVLGIPRPGFITGAVLVPVVLLFIVGLLGMRRYKRVRSSNYQQLKSLEGTQERGVEESTPQVEKPEICGFPGKLSFPKSGLCITSDGPEEDQITNVGVEICNEETSLPALGPDEMQLSPVVKFHSHSLHLSEPVKLTIPHSASCSSPEHGWCIKVQKAELARYNSDVKWSSVPEAELVQIESNEVNMETTELLAYVVSGKAGASGGPAKKRMKCMAFASEAAAGKDLTITVVLLDDCESSFEKVIQTERQKGMHILGGVQSLHIEAFTREPIRLTVQDISPGWAVQIPPKDITYEQWSKSFLKIPREYITFRRSDSSKWEFSCTIGVRARNASVEIPLYTYLQENSITKELQKQMAERESQDNEEGLVMLNPDEPSTPLLRLPTNVLHNVCLLLDRPYRNVGDWRHVAAKLRFSSDQIQGFGKENLDPDGSPSTQLFQALLCLEMQFTVADLIEILQDTKIKRYDVVQILRPYVLLNPEVVTSSGTPPAKEHLQLV